MINYYYSKQCQSTKIFFFNSCFKLHSIHVMFTAPYLTDLK